MPYLEVDNVNDAQTIICEMFDEYTEKQNIDDATNMSLIVFDIDHALFIQKDEYVKDPKFYKLSSIGKIQNKLVEQIKQISPNTYFIGITTKTMTKEELETIKQKSIKLDLIIGRKNSYKGSRHNLQNNQIKAINKIRNKYGAIMTIALVINKNLETICLRYFSFTPDISVYEDNANILIPIIVTFIKNIKPPAVE